MGKSTKSTKFKRPKQYRPLRMAGVNHFPDGAARISVGAQYISEQEHHVIIALRNWEVAARIPGDRAIHLTDELVRVTILDAVNANDASGADGEADFAAVATRHKMSAEEAAAFRTVARFRERTIKSTVKTLFAEAKAERKAAKIKTESEGAQNG